MKSQVDRWGSSLAIRLPKHIAEALNLQPNDDIELTVTDEKVILSSIHDDSPNFTLDELLEQVTELPEPEIDWGSTMGEEIW
ncbi:MAG: AbrB/MazE/SpoVT family DNA-binding domain-containing protein [Cyanobacteria bacterium J06623_4]